MSATGSARRGLGRSQFLLIGPLAWGFTPLIRPLRWWRLSLTYLVPLIPLLILWDGVVSSRCGPMLPRTLRG